MMKTRIFFMLFAVALLWCGCSKNDDESGAPDDDARLIRVSASAIDVIASQSTRAVVEGSAFSGQTARVLATVEGGDYSSLHCNGTMTFNNYDYAYYDNISPSSSKHYPADGVVMIYGLYPANDWVGHNDLDVEEAKVSHTVDGCTDLMMTNIGKSVLNGICDINFRHLLTLLNFKLTKTVSNTINVEEIILTKTAANNGEVHTKCDVFLNEEDVDFYSDPNNVVISAFQVHSDYGFADEVRTDDDVVAYMLVAPLSKTEVDRSEKDYTLTVTYTIDFGEPQIATVDLQLYNGSIPYSGSTMGKSFEITLTFKGHKITAQAYMNEWDTGGTAEGTI
jgi:hypothetical protein